jgi:hypothetical protein
VYSSSFRAIPGPKFVVVVTDLFKPAVLNEIFAPFVEGVWIDIKRVADGLECRPRLAFLAFAGLVIHPDFESDTRKPEDFLIVTIELLERAGGGFSCGDS